MMPYGDIVGSALFALRGNWLRSTLTALGVIIGIAAVIIMLSVGEGTQAQLDKMISNLGSNRLDVSSGALTFGVAIFVAPRAASSDRPQDFRRAARRVRDHWAA